jgi:tetratricopeptide (TPR) repeat protein
VVYPRVLALGLIALFAAQSARAEGWASGTAAELTRQGQEHVKNGDAALATRRFAEAIALDPTFGPAYLELGAARERAGDAREAERTYSVAIERVPNFAPALRARAALLGRLGQSDRAIADLEAVTRLDEGPEALRDLATRYVELRAWPAALGCWRRMLALAEQIGNDPLSREATLQIKALSVLAAELDPVIAGMTSRDWVRRAEASVAKRRGM